MTKMSNKIEHNENENYNCEMCLYSTCRKHNYNRHLNSKKHKNSLIVTKGAKTSNENQRHFCECGKSYKYRQGLSTHRKNCSYNEYKIEALEKENKILKEINKLKDDMINTLKNNKLSIKGSFNNNSFNNKNDIKIFLSEHCANVLSIQDFVKQLTISLDDLMHTKDNTVKCITTIIERNLKPLSLTNRPVHYVDNNDWFIKNKEEWNEDDGNTLVDKTHHKIQKEYLDQSEKEVLNDHDYLLFVKNGTSELDNKNKEFIKSGLLKHCEKSN